MTVKLLTEEHLEFISFKGDCTDLSESTLVKIPNCWKSHVPAHMQLNTFDPFHEILACITYSSREDLDTPAHLGSIV